MSFFSGSKLFGDSDSKIQSKPASVQNSNQGRRPVVLEQRISIHSNIEGNINPVSETAPNSNNINPSQNIENPNLVEPTVQTNSNLNKSSTTSAPSQPVSDSTKESYVQPKQQNISHLSSVAIVPENLGLINDIKFSDVYVTPDKKCYIWSGKTDCGLKYVSFQDFPEFFAKMESLYDGNRSYLLNYHGRNYRVERTIALEGPQYCARKMPIEVPDLKQLGFPSGVLSHLMSLAGCSGLILLAGATGSGKSTTVSALLKEYLERKGGYAFTIEDPIEMPLDGVYVTRDGELGLCKQTTPPDGSWEEGIKSALRSKPRYIYLGEIRSPDVASEALRAATSGHLVLSTIHANNVSDAVNALVKYAASSGISEEMAYELVANGFLGCIHQILTGAPKRAILTYLFANPDVNAGCQVRGMLRSGKLNMATLIDKQRVNLERNLPIFSRF